MVKGLIRKMMFSVAAGVLGGAVIGVITVPKLLNYDFKNIVCELGGENGNYNPTAKDVTTRDVYCKIVILPDGRLRFPQEAPPLQQPYEGYIQRVEPLQNPSKKDCGSYFKLEDDGECHYYPPEFSEESFDI